jgi:hypothetical protein
MIIPLDSPPDNSFASINHTSKTDIDIKIVGLYCGSFGRSFYSHNICGEHVVPGDHLRLAQTAVEVNGVIKEAVKWEWMSIRLIAAMMDFFLELKSH